MAFNQRWRHAICFLFLAIVPLAKAEQLTARFDPEKTQVQFVLGDVLHTVHGTFRLKEGHVSFDPGAPSMSGALVVDAASGQSGSSARDKRMTRDILEAQRFPEIRFSPESYVGTLARSGPSDVQVTGSFVIHGQAHTVVIPMHIALSGNEVTTSGKFLIPYVEWGMKDPSNFLLKVKTEVEIDLAAVGRIE